MKGERWFGLLSVGLVLALLAGLSHAQDPASAPLGTAFTYQGQLKSSGAPYTGTCDLRFKLYDDPSNGTQIGPTQTRTGMSLTDGYLTAQLDFGSGSFQGDARWLNVEVCCPTGSCTYMPLAPRQALTPAPYALYSATAPWSGLSGLPAGFADGVDNDTLGGLSCTNGQVAKWTGSAHQWQCGTDNNTSYSAGTGLILSGTTFSADTTYLQRRVSGSCTTGNAIRVVNQDGTVTCEPVGGGGNAWLLTGNAGTTPGANYLGTSDNQALELKVNGARALRLEPNSTGPNLIGGYAGNSVISGAYGATIGGGGNLGGENRVTDAGGTVGGGSGNWAGDNAGSTTDAQFATVGGGEYNTAIENYATVCGGQANEATGEYAAVGGGANNVASSLRATIGGGESNQASNEAATVGGGVENSASGLNAVVGGGGGNEADGENATIGGGLNNDASGTGATVPGGLAAVAGMYGQMAYASGAFATAGDAQYSVYVMRCVTTWSSTKDFYLDGVDDRLVLTSGRTMMFEILIAARSEWGDSAAFRCSGVIERGGDTTHLVGAACEDLGSEGGFGGFRVGVFADDTNDALGVQASQGLYTYGDTRWVAVVQAAEVSWP